MMAPRLGWTTAAGAALLLLQACGNPDDGVATTAAAPAAADARMRVLAAEPAAASAAVVAISTVSEKRITRTVYEYVMKVTISNGAIPQAGITARLTGAGAGTSRRRRPGAGG